jgi:transposase
LTDTQRRKLVRLLARGAERVGYATQLWTAERIQRLVLEHFGARYHVNHVPKLLRQCGWSYQRPTGRAVERDEAEVRRWVRDEWPRIKKKPAG